MIRVTEKYYISPTRSCYIVYTKNPNIKIIEPIRNLEEEAVAEDFSLDALLEDKQGKRRRKDRVFTNPTYHATLESALREIVRKLEYDDLTEQEISIQDALLRIEKLHESFRSMLSKILEMDWSVDADGDELE